MERKWKLIYVEGLCPSARIVNVADHKKGFSDWVCELPFSTPSEAEEMPEQVKHARVICYAPELLAELKRVRELLAETRDYENDVSKIDYLIGCADPS